MLCRVLDFDHGSNVVDDVSLSVSLVLGARVRDRLTNVVLGGSFSVIDLRLSSQRC